MNTEVHMYPPFDGHVVMAPEKSLHATPDSQGRPRARTSFASNDGLALCGYHSPTGGWSLSRHLAPNGVGSPKQELVGGIFPTSLGASASRCSLTLGLVRSPSLSCTLQSASVTGLSATANPIQTSYHSKNGATEGEVTPSVGFPQSFSQTVDLPSQSVARVPAGQQTEVQGVNVRPVQRRSCITPARKQTSSVRVDSLGPNAKLIRLPQPSKKIEAGRSASRGPSRSALGSTQDANARMASKSSTTHIGSICTFAPPSRVEQNARLVHRLPSGDTGRSTPGSATTNRREAVQNRLFSIASRRLVPDSPRNKNWAPVLTENPQAPAAPKVPVVGPLAAATARLRSSSVARPCVRAPARALDEKTASARLVGRRDSGLAAAEPSYLASTIASKAKQREIAEVKRAPQRPSPETALEAPLRPAPDNAVACLNNAILQRPKQRAPSPMIRHPTPLIRNAAPLIRNPTPLIRRPSQKSQTQERPSSPRDKRQPTGQPQVVQRQPSPQPPKQGQPSQRAAEIASAPTRKPSPQRAQPAQGDGKDAPLPAAASDAERRRFRPTRRNTLTNIAVRGIRGITGTHSGPRMALLRRSGSTVATSRLRNESSDSKAPQPGKPVSVQSTSKDSPVLEDAASSSTPIRLHAPTWGLSSRLSDAVCPLDTLATIKSENRSSSTLVSPITLAASPSVFSSVGERKESPQIQVAKPISPPLPTVDVAPLVMPQAESKVESKEEASLDAIDTAQGSLDSAVDSPDNRKGVLSTTDTHSPTARHSNFSRDTIASPLGRISPSKRSLISPSIPTSVTVVSLTPILPSADRAQPCTPEGARDKLTQWYESREDTIPCDIGVEEKALDIAVEFDNGCPVNLTSPTQELPPETKHASECEAESEVNEINVSPDTVETTQNSGELEAMRPVDVLPSINSSVWSFMESRYKQTGLWTQKKSHPCATEEEIRVLTEILDREWDTAEFDWHECPEELESNIRYALRYGGDQVCVVVGDIFCQGMNKFVTLRREGTSVTIFWPCSLKLQANAQRMF